jgi:hypothetical protein
LPDDEHKKPEDDKFSPEAIAARIDKIGVETEADRIAREEEQKLLARKKQQAHTKKGGLEAAASKRLAKIGETAVKRPTAGQATAADPLLDRLARARKWTQEHRASFAGVTTVVLLAAAALGGWAYWQDKRQGDASMLLGRAFADDHAHLASKGEGDDEGTKRQLYPTFATAAERRGAALAKYRELQAKYPGTGAAILARLDEGALLLDAQDAKGALSAYEDAKNSSLAKADPEVRGRALEGIGFCHELLAARDEGNKDKHLEDALAAYRKLQTVDADGFKELGMYDEARVLLAQGDKTKALELLKEANKRVSEPGAKRPFAYLQFALEDALRELDPSALPPKAPRPGAGSAGGANLDNPKIQEIIRQLQQQQKSQGSAPPLGSAPGTSP